MGDIASFLIERRCGKGIYDPEVRIESINDETWTRNRIIDTWSDVGDKKARCLGLPAGFPTPVASSIDHQYLRALRESITEHGFDQSNPIIAYDLGNGTLYIKDSHRLACLIALHPPSFPVIVLSPETGWNE